MGMCCICRASVPLWDLFLVPVTSDAWSKKTDGVGGEGLNARKWFGEGHLTSMCT